MSQPLTHKASRLHSLYLNWLPVAALHVPIILDWPLGMERVQTSRGNSSETQGPLCYRQNARISREGCKNKNELRKM